MPWGINDVERHKKGLSPRAKRVWVRVANATLKRCGGGSDCEANAIKAANAVAGRMKEAAVYWLDEAEFSAKQREKLAAGGQALPDGSFPIRNKEDLSNAVQAFGRAKNKRQVKAHIIKRAKALGAVKMLPESWNVSEADRSYDKTRSLVQAALSNRSREAWVRDLFDDRVIYEQDGKTWIAGYKIDEEKEVSLEDPAEAEMVFVPVGKAADESFAFPRAHPIFREALATSLVEDEVWAEEVLLAASRALADGDLEEGLQTVEEEFIPLVEKSVRSDGTLPIKIIQPGWGSSAYYKPEILERDGAKAFPAGTKMYWDHPTISEEKERPERSLRDLAAELVTDARYKEEGPKGPGLYADAKVFGDYKNAVEELAGSIGVSIRANGRGKVGEIEGKRGPILEELVSSRSVDFVTEPGAGGAILEVFEANRGKHRIANGSSTTTTNSTTIREGSVTIGQSDGGKGEDSMDKELQEAKEAAERERDEAKTEAARLREALLLREAGDLVTEALAEVEKEMKVTLLDSTRKRLSESLTKNPPTTDDGKIDRKSFDERITEAVKAEVAYLAEISGSGKVRGMGPAETTENDDEKLEEVFGRLGMTESERKVAAAGR